MIDKKLDLIIAKLEHHDKRFDQNDKKFELIFTKLVQHDERFDQQDRKLELMISKHEEQAEKSELLFARLDHHENMIVTLIKSVATTNTYLEELTSEIRHSHVDMQYVKEDIHNIKDDVHYIKGDVTFLKENQQIMLQMQQEQQKILERPSLRSITHEADIAELRQIK